jgi:hypothetical protein
MDFEDLGVARKKILKIFPISTCKTRPKRFGDGRKFGEFLSFRPLVYLRRS